MFLKSLFFISVLFYRHKHNSHPAIFLSFFFFFFTKQACSLSSWGRNGWVSEWICKKRLGLAKISFNGSCHEGKYEGNGVGGGVLATPPSHPQPGGQVWKNVMCRPRLDGSEHFPFPAGVALGNINNIKSRYKRRAADTLRSLSHLRNCSMLILIK